MQVLVTRLEKALTTASGLLPNQYGFCRRKSTIDAAERVHQIAREAIKGDRWMYGTKEFCLVVTIAVKNAFNSANWFRIMTSLRSFRVPRYLEEITRNYFQDRVLLYTTNKGNVNCNLTGGVPQ